MFFKKKNKMKIDTFYPKNRIFHYINHNFFGEENNNIIISQRFCKDTGYYPNTEHPQTLNEKILWLTQYYHNPLATRCADKYLIKEYIKEHLGEDLCIPTLKTYNSIYDIKLEELPNQFVLKVNWGGSEEQVIVVRDKNQVSIDEIRMKIDDWLQPWNNNYYNSYVWAYKDMKPIIYAEKYIEKRNGDSNIYKIYCFNGKAKMILVISDKFKTNQTTKTFLDKDGNILPVKRPKNPINKTLVKPNSWEKMINIAEQLAQPFPLLRVDFYVIDDKPYIEKMAFHSENGFDAFAPKEWDLKFGNELHLPEKQL